MGVSPETPDMEQYMTRQSLKYLIPALLISVPLPAFAAPVTYTIDPTHTAVTFSIDHFGFSAPSGKFMNIEGEIIIDEDAPEASSVSVTIPVDMINTGVPDLDTHLKGADFFDVESFPNATFKSDSVELTGEKTAKVSGMLTLHGVTKPVVLDVTLNQIAENMFGKQTAGFAASATILRSDFGMKTYLPGLGDEITLEIDSEANL